MKNSNFKPLTARSAHFQETAKQTGFWIDKQHSTINQKNDDFSVSWVHFDYGIKFWQIFFSFLLKYR